MKTKFVKVSVEERLPELKDDSVVIEFENGELASVHREDWFKDITNGKDEKGAQLYTKWYLSTEYIQGKVLNWLEEVPDREAEMLEMLNLSLNNFDSTLDYLKDSEFENDLTERIVPVMADIEMLIEDIRMSK